MDEIVSHGKRLTDAEVADIRRRRPGVRASLACEGMVLTSEEEALFDQMDREGLNADDSARQIIEMNRVLRRRQSSAADCR